jgi:hypothetical protein
LCQEFKIIVHKSRIDLMKKVLLFIILCCVWAHEKLAAQSVVSADGSYYHLQLYNHNPHSATMEVYKGDKLVEVRGVAPQSSFFVSGSRFTKRKLNKMTVRYSYTQSNLNYDIKAATYQYDATVQQIQTSEAIIQKKSIDKFMVKLTAIAAANLRASEGAGFWETLFFDALNFGGNIVITGFAITEGIGQMSEISRKLDKIRNQNYETLDSYLNALDKELKEYQQGQEIEKMVRQIGQIVGNKLGLSQRATSQCKDAIAICVQELIGNSIESAAKIEQAQNIKDKRIAYLENVFQGNQRKSFNLLSLLPTNTHLKEDTPHVLVGFDPFVWGNNLNPYWTSAPETLFSADSTGSVGAINAYFGASLGVPITYEFQVGRTKSRLYAQVAYRQTGYWEDSLGMKFSRNFFATVPPNATRFTTTAPIRLQQSNISAQLTWRFFISSGYRSVLDLNAGCMRQTTVLDLSHAPLSTGFSWAVPQISISEPVYLPYGGIKWGYNTSGQIYKGARFSIGADVFKVKLENSSNFKLADGKTNQLVPFASDRVNYKIYLGFEASF